MSRLDEEKLALLRRWGEGLTADDREELRAAGRAILMLSDEIERLHIDLWHARDPQPVEPDEIAEPAPEPTLEPAAAASLTSTLRRRIAALALRSTER